MRGSKLEIINRSPQPGKILTGAKTILKLNGKVVPFATKVEFQIAARGLATATITLLLTELDFKNYCKVNKKIKKVPENSRRSVMGRYSETAIRSKKR